MNSSLELQTCRHDLTAFCEKVSWRNAAELQSEAIHAGRETGKLVNKDLGAAPKSNSVLEFPTIWIVLAKIHSYPEHHGIPVLGC